MEHVNRFHPFHYCKMSEGLYMLVSTEWCNRLITLYCDRCEMWWRTFSCHSHLSSSHTPSTTQQHPQTSATSRNISHRIMSTNLQEHLAQNIVHQPQGTSLTEYCPPTSRNFSRRIMSTKLQEHLTPSTYLLKRLLRSIKGYLKGSAAKFPRWLWRKSLVWKSQTFSLFLNKVLHKNLHFVTWRRSDTFSILFRKQGQRSSM